MAEKSREELQEEIQELRDRLEVAEETLRAIREGEIDAIVVSSPQGDRVFTLEGADYPYRLFVEGMKEGAATITSQGIILYCNSRFAALLKQPLEKVIGTSFPNFLSPLDQQLFQALSRQADIGVGKGELSLIASDDTKLPVQVAINRLKINSDVNCLIITDLSEQKRNEEILVAEKLARSILEQAAEVIIVCDEQGKIIRASEMASQLCRENPIFQLFDDVLPLQFSQQQEVTGQKAKDTQKNRNNSAKPSNGFSLSTVFEEKRLQGVEVIFARKDGQVFNLLLSARSMSDADNLYQGCVVTLTDITRLKQAEVDLKQLNETLENRVRERTLELIQANTRLHQELLERQRVEQALQESQSLLTSIIEGSIDSIAAIDMDFRFIAFNSAYKAEFLKLFGRDVDIGTSLIEALAHQVEQQTMLVNDWRRALGGEQFTAIQEFADNEGDRIYYEVTYSSIRDNQGRQIGASHIVKNVSDRIRSEQALRESEQRLQLALEASESGLWDWNIVTGEVYYNPRYLQMLGYQADEFPRDGSTWERLVHPEDMPWVEKILEAHLQDSSVSYAFDYRLLSKSGEWKWIADYGKVVERDEHGKPLRMVGTHRDVSERKQAEKELELQAAIAKIMPGGICLIRATDRAIVYTNPKFESIFGYAPGELNGQPVSLLNYEGEHASAEETTREILQAIETYGETSYEIHNVKKDGTPFWCRATASKFHHPVYGKIYIAVQQDITEHKKAEERVKASLKEKEVLLKEIHHRVKNNLQIVTSLLQMQSRRSQEPQVTDVLRDSQSRIKSIALVHEKLYRSDDLSNINFGQYIPDLTTHLFDTYNVSSSAIALNIQVEPISLGIDTAIPCGLIINELVSNSLKYAFPHQRKGEIQVEFRASSDDTLRLIVRDNGIGISTEFDIETTTSLGLTLVQGLVEQLEGTLECDRDRGTEFKITFSVNG